MADTDPDTSRLILSLSGAFTVRDASGDALEGISRRGQALLAYLSLQPDMRAERARIADLLWSDRSEEQARASLRQELSVLRRKLPDGVLETNRQQVWVNSTTVATDDQGQGAFLEGFDLNSEGFEEWLRETRHNLVAREDAPASPTASPRTRNRPSLAVLPFEEIGAKAGDMFADGVVEEITSALGRIQDFHVIARQSVFALQRDQLNIPQIAETLGVEYVVEGSVQRAGDRVRISVNLVEGKEGRTVWSERFNDRLDDLFDLQDRIAGNVAGRILPSLRSAEIARASTTPPENRSAYEVFLTALPQMWSHQEGSNARALQIFDRSLALSADYGPALAFKAWALAQQSSYIWSDDPLTAKAEALKLARRAAQCVGDHVPSMVAIGAAFDQASSDHAFSQSFLDRALALDPSSAWGWMRKGWNQSYSDQGAQALKSFDHAEALSPLDPFLFNIEFGRGATHMREGRYEEALERITHGMTLAPGVAWAYRFIAALNIYLGQHDSAKEAYEKLLVAYPRLTIQKLRHSMPPSAVENRPEFYDAMQQAGIPEV